MKESNVYNQILVVPDGMISILQIKSILFLINLLGQYYGLQSTAKESWVQRDLVISPRKQGW